MFTRLLKLLERSPVFLPGFVAGPAPKTEAELRAERVGRGENPITGVPLREPMSGPYRAEWIREHEGEEPSGYRMPH